MKALPNELCDVKWCPDPNNELMTIKIALDFITPIYGGGIEAGVADQAMPIRGTEIKGMLRHWWRVYKPQYTLDDEIKIWGGQGLNSNDGTKSSVSIKAKAKAKAITTADRKLKESNICNYFMFPAKKQRNEPAKQLLNNTMASVEITCPLKYKEDVVNTILLWLTFGGYGARTRRGAGSFGWQSKDIPELSEELLKKLVNKLPKNSWALIKNEKSADSSWKNMDHIYNDFRQGKGYARNKGNDPKKPGRSKWPEPDAIRLITGHHSNNHEPAPTAQKAFPRAELGLPIITEFRSGPGEPGKTELLPFVDGKTLERWGSPIIMKPVKIGKEIKSLVVCVGSHIPDFKLALKRQGQNKYIEANLPIKPGNPQNIFPLENYKVDSAINALKEFFKECEFKEVK